MHLGTDVKTCISVYSPVYVVDQGTIEEKIYQRQVTKLALGDSVVDAVKESQIKFSPEDLKVCQHHYCFVACNCLQGLQHVNRHDSPPNAFKIQTSTNVTQFI